MKTEAAAHIFVFMWCVENICWSDTVLPLTLIGHEPKTPHPNVCTTLSPTYALPGGVIVSVCLIMTKGEVSSLFPVLLFNNSKRNHSVIHSFSHISNLYKHTAALVSKRCVKWRYGIDLLGKSSARIPTCKLHTDFLLQNLSHRRLRFRQVSLFKYQLSEVCLPFSCEILFESI